MTTGYVGDGETMPTTPEEALELISGYIMVIDEREEREDLGFAINILANLIRESREHDCEQLEWGKPGDCWERIYNDPDIHEALDLGDQYGDATFPKNEESWESVQVRAIALGLGDHYGNPHCIWCLQGD